ncbi:MULTISPECIES: DUF3311 domain-containing protein [Pandoraea]|uniref:DUF3311 domain-containing protein n=1 Tax=Pandoraea thiooxydans TaxID=445709 RepID=A0A0G3EML4_9BURK|nr:MULTISPECIES: DUF3311 domain-containing protein [Pandoraea]AKJ68323.1 hypothetical protein ABW99_08955 [Pandoraea thiooxydans]APR95658.1 hypothetical protein PATSB16_23180 [Pandoraea thiooxydans]TAL52299.1 MAG: DUF3311 domain-containing protein [Pandoraea sp.]TAM16109.1 MAG: DUF3311 domain-containing protein [Pandoraea sp.]
MKSTIPAQAGARWRWLLLLPWIALFWVPSYNAVEPTLAGFPFFYWYQLLWVLLSAAITALVYVKTRGLHAAADEREATE